MRLYSENSGFLEFFIYILNSYNLVTEVHILHKHYPGSTSVATGVVLFEAPINVR